MNKLLKSGIMLMTAMAVVGCSADTKNAIRSTEQTVVENIMTRRSIRNYKSEPVCREQMAKVVECGIYAPSAMNSQGWAVRLVDAPDFIEGVTNIAVAQRPEIKEQAGFRNIFRNAPTVAFIAIPEQSYSGEYDSGLLSQNMMLSAWSMGIGSCCLGSAVPVMNSEEAKPYLERLNFPEGYKLMMVIGFGYPEGDIPVAPERDASKAYYIE